MVSNDLLATVGDAVATAGHDKTRLLDIVAGVQSRLGHLSDDALLAIAAALDMPYVEVVDAVSFYAFFSREPQAACRIRFSRTPISLMKGAAEVMRAFEEAIAQPDAGGEAGDITVSWSSDIGMADHEPACLIDGMAFTDLVPADAAPIVREIRSLRSAGALPRFPGIPSAAGFTSAKAGCVSKIVRRGPVFFTATDTGAGLRRALNMTPDAVVDEIARSGLRGRGGAGFPTGLKWRMTRRARGTAHYIICNADEGEPGTFKDRVLLSDAPNLVFEGMTIAGYALGAKTGFLYLRAEYAYLFSDLERVLSERRRLGLLGPRAGGCDAFDFDIRVQIGAGAYVCGEESALIESLEGKRGAPRDRPPYPADHGYLGQPTAVNNVETLACAARILERGASWFSQYGTAESKGTKLMCVSGDCAMPGIYEVPFGTTLNELLDLAGAADAEAVQVSGAAGQCVAPKDFGRTLAYEDLATGGSTMIFGPQRDVLQAVLLFAEFFVAESCGWCVPCRVGTVLLKEHVQRVLGGHATQADIAALEKLAGSVAKLSRCGLGQTAPNPILSTLRDFPHLYASKLVPAGASRIDVRAALGDAP